jgi:hypothetical protein
VAGDPLAILGDDTGALEGCEISMVPMGIIGYPMFSHGKRYRCFLKPYFLKHVNKRNKTDNIPVKVEP